MVRRGGFALSKEVYSASVINSGPSMGAWGESRTHCPDGSISVSLRYGIQADTLTFGEAPWFELSVRVTADFWMLTER